MWRVTVRNLIARKFRLFLSAFAIVLGVAFVAGSFIFTDALGGTFTGIIRGTTPDVVVQPEGAGDFEDTQDARTIDAAVVDELSELPEASAVSGAISMQGVYVIGDDGKLVGGNGPPGLGVNYTETEAITGKQIASLSEGELPVGEGQVALDERTADKAGYEIGDEVSIVTSGTVPHVDADLTGLIEFGSEGGLAGATLTVMDRTWLQDLFYQGQDVYNRVELTAADGVTQAELAAAAEPLLPKGIIAEEGDVVAERDTKQIEEDLQFINYFLLVFAAVSMVVGTFIIVNTFAILVAQRSRELALLRAMGASKRQVNRSVLGEALAIAVIGSTVGIVIGYLLARGIKMLFELIGLDMAGADFPLKARTILVSYIVGIVVTMVAAYVPARRAGKVSPVAAMRDDVSMPEASTHRRMIVGSVIIAVGLGLMVLGFMGEGGTGLLGIGVGMLAILVGVALLAAIIGRPVIHGLGALYRRMFGTVGTLATENSLRNPRRTAATASALMIGLTLITLMSILGASSKESFAKIIDQAITSELVVSNAVGAPFSPTIAEEIRQVDGVDTVAQYRYANATIDGRDAWLGGVDPQSLPAVLNLLIEDGSAQQFGNGSVLLDADEADSLGVKAGDTIDLELQTGVTKFKVAATFQAGSMPSSFMLTLGDLAKGGYAEMDSLLFITASPGADIDSVRSEIDGILADLPTVTLKNQEEFVDEQLGFLNIMLYIIYALSGLAVLIAVLGIINTLALSVIERTREVGLLRAIGLSRRQLRRMVRLESIAIAILGAVLGIGMGLAFGVGLQRAIADEGIDVLAVPWTVLIVLAVLSAVAGILAALLPARRAGKLNVLEAITTE
jgi:putative ABC transport system permease protein